MGTRLHCNKNAFSLTTHKLNAGVSSEIILHLPTS